jgi:urease accessory protein
MKDTTGDGMDTTFKGCRIAHGGAAAGRPARRGRTGWLPPGVRGWPCAGVAALALGLPTLAQAHAESGAASGLLAGLAHPVSGLDHVLAMIAVGLWGAQLGRPAIWLLPVVFPIVMALGGFLGLIGVPLPGLEIGIALSAVALGLMVASAARPPMWVAAALVGVFAVFHGHAHGTELPEGSSGVLYSIGFVVATGSLHAAGVGTGMVQRWPSGRTALRLAGGLVLLAGGWFLWRALA